MLKAYLKNRRFEAAVLWKHWTLCYLMAESNSRTKMWCRILRKQKKQMDRVMECEGELKRGEESYFRDGVCGMTTVAPPPLSPSLSLPRSIESRSLKLLTSGPVRVQNFSNRRPFSPSLSASHDKYRTLLPFQNELWHTCTPPDCAWDLTVYKGRAWVAPGEWDNELS